jgi:hypothetical protein
MFNNSTNSIGVDLGDKCSFIPRINQEGELIEESRLPTNRAPFQRIFPSSRAGSL